MKKFLALLLIIIITCFTTVYAYAETEQPIDADTKTTEAISTMPITTSDTYAVSETSQETSNKTVIPAIDSLVNFFFDGKITVSQIVEYLTVALTAIFSFAYSKYKRALIAKEKAISKTDIEIEALKRKEQDMANQIGLLGNIIVCAYLSNNLIEPELKKRLAAYADELMKNTTINKDRLSEKLILAAQKADSYKAKITDITAIIDKEAQEAQEHIDTLKEDIMSMQNTLTQGAPVETQKASAIIDSLKIED
jgi:polyhydroxyalkanoate synthesis regulator phasin